MAGIHGTAGMSRAIGPGEVHALLAASKSEREHLLISVLYETGCRIGEAVLLRCGHLNAEERILTLRNLKRKKTASNPDGFGEKSLIVSQELIDEIEGYTVHLAPTAYIFRGRRVGTHLTVRQARTLIYEASIAALVTQVHPGDALPRPIWPHVLRHSSARNLLRAGVNLKIIADRLGHSQIRNTALYLASDTDEQRKAVEGIRW